MFQLLNLLDVIIDNAESKQPPADRGVSVTEESSGQTSAEDANASAKSSKAEDTDKPSSSGGITEYDSHAILLNLPQAELRLLCSLLAREGYCLYFSVDVYFFYVYCANIDDCFLVCRIMLMHLWRKY